MKWLRISSDCKTPDMTEVYVRYFHIIKSILSLNRNVNLQSLLISPAEKMKVPVWPRLIHDWLHLSNKITIQLSDSSPIMILLKFGIAC